MKKLKWVLVFLVLLIVIWFFVRFFSHREIDDVSPGIFCEKNYLEKSDVLWIIPDYLNKSIANETDWCVQISGMNKILGLHGVFHSYNEFSEDRNIEYLDKGIGDFEKCFGYKPEMFKAPQLSITENNILLIEGKGMKVRGMWNQIAHKVYHCSDTGVFPNWLIDLF